MAALGLVDHTFNYNGLTFGYDTGYYVDHHEGLEGFDTRMSDSDQPRGDGGIRGLDYVAPRVIAFTLALGETSDTTYETRLAAIRAAFLPSRSVDQALTFKRPGQPERFVNCRPIQLTRIQEYLQFGQIGKPPLVLRAVDPRIYSSAQYSANATVFATTGGGMDWPVTNWGIDFAGATQNFLSATNSGTAEAYPLIRFYGPTVGTCTGVTLTNLTNGTSITVATTITTGQILTADMSAAVIGANSSVIDLSGSSRYGSWPVPRTPFSLSPGNNTLKFTVTGTSTDCLCNVTWRDTWMD
jgi:Siphovirus-type tail component, C-terminal domain